MIVSVCRLWRQRTLAGGGHPSSAFTRRPYHRRELHWCEMQSKHMQMRRRLMCVIADLSQWIRQERDPGAKKCQGQTLSSSNLTRSTRSPRPSFSHVDHQAASCISFPQIRAGLRAASAGKTLRCGCTMSSCADISAMRHSCSFTNRQSLAYVKLM